METRAVTILFLTSMMILTCNLIYATTTTQRYVKKMTGYKLTGSVLKLVSRPGMNSIVCAASCQPSTCKSATDSSIENICMTLQERFYETSITMSVDSTWSVLYVIEDTGQSLIQVSVYDTWNATGVRDDHPIGEISGECLRLDNVGSCTQHFRSQILDNWENIDQVRFSLYKNGVEVKYITFNGTDTDNESWFSHSKVLETSWTELSSTSMPFEYFSIKGYRIPGESVRGFFIATFGGCPGDIMYSLALETTYDFCQYYWNIPVPNYPLFMYSPNTGVIRP